MCAAWSEQARLLIERRDVLARAEQAFMADWARVLKEVHRYFSLKEWLCRLTGDPPNCCLQLWRKDWPGGELQVHYEVLCNHSFFLRGLVDLSLHVEPETPNQMVVCNHIRSLLRPYSDKIHSLLSSYTPSMPDSPVQDILKGQLPLDAVTPEAICKALEGMMQTESFVDEAIYLTGKRSIWRTDFFKGNAVPVIDWSQWSGKEGGEGGWRRDSEAGRLNSPCLRCSGDTFNYHDKRNILAIGDNGPFHYPFSQQSVYGSAIVCAPHGGHLRLSFQTTKEGNWQRPFTANSTLAERDEWQHVTWEGVLGRLENYNPDEEGLYAYLLVDAPQKSIIIDSFEIGLC